MFFIAVFIVSGEFDKREVDKRHQARINIESRIFDITKIPEVSEEVDTND